MISPQTGAAVAAQLSGSSLRDMRLVVDETTHVSVVFPKSGDFQSRRGIEGIVLPSLFISGICMQNCQSAALEKELQRREWWPPVVDPQHPVRSAVKQVLK